MFFLIQIFLCTYIRRMSFTSQEQAKFLLGKCSSAYISTQVINEFVNVFLKKRKVPIETLMQAVDQLEENFAVVAVTTKTVRHALHLAQTYKYSYFDCLIVASAEENNCAVLYTEDLHNKHIIHNRLQVINPFAMD
jgi:predicted nucleic acid-binding protein